MSIIIEAPNEVYSLENNNNIKLFLAGGITNCPDWQSTMINMLKSQKNLTIYNPRRENFPIDDPNAAEEQITWEYNHLRDADIISFWFSKGSLNPIVLYELGKWGNSTNKKIFIGMDKEYERQQDVIIQTDLSNKDVEYVFTLKELSQQIVQYLKMLNY